MPPDRVTVAIPTYNEKENLPDISKAVTAHGYRLLVVDDSSPDGTGELADRLAGEDGLLSVLHRSKKEGLGPAYAAAFDKALAEEPRSSSRWTPTSLTTPPTCPVWWRQSTRVQIWPSDPGTCEGVTPRIGR